MSTQVFRIELEFYVNCTGPSKSLEVALLPFMYVVINNNLVLFSLFAVLPVFQIIVSAICQECAFIWITLHLL